MKVPTDVDVQIDNVWLWALGEALAQDRMSLLGCPSWVAHVLREGKMELLVKPSWRGREEDCKRKGGGEEEIWIKGEWEQ